VATSRASVVLPVPGGPQRIMETGRPPSTMVRNDAPGESRCSCPTTSSRVRGRILAASGAACSRCARRWSEKRSSSIFELLPHLRPELEAQLAELNLVYRGG